MEQNMALFQAHCRELANELGRQAVSYTHLDVYKRQQLGRYLYKCCFERH